MEVIRPGEHSGHRIMTITGSKGSGPVLAFVFGMEDAQAARKAGRRMAAKGYAADVAERELLEEARAKYHGSNLFVKAYMFEASNAYNNSAK
jgi:hypothetical protein